jgi:hypothetical protein
MISTNPSANIDKRKHRINNIADSGLVFNTQKKNKFSDNVEQIYSKDNFNIISNKLLDSFDNMEKNIDNKKETYKNQYESQNNNSNEENTNINLIPSSHTSLYNHYNSNLLGYNNIKNINDIITPNKKIIRSGSVGLINLENNKQNNKKKYIEYNSNKINGNKKIINLYNNITNLNQGEYTNIFNIANKIEPNNIKIIHKSHIYDNNSNSQRTRSNNNTNIENRARNMLKLNNSKNTFYLPKLNGQKVTSLNNYEYSFINNNRPNVKSKNKLNISQFKFKINKGTKKGFNLNNNNKLLQFPSNNYKQIFKRSESSGFINFRTNLNNNKSNRAMKNSSGNKKFMGLSNSLASLGLINNSKDKKIKRNASELFLS